MVENNKQGKLNVTALKNQRFLFSLIKTVLCLIAFAVPHHVKTAETSQSVEILKAVWVYKFLNFIEWPNENNIETITISYWGDDDTFYKNLSALRGKKVRNNLIKIIRQTDISPQSNPQVVIIGKNKSSSLPKLHNLLSGKNILVISDNATSKQSTMINFVYPSSNSISFELNRYNIIYEKLSLSSEILVIGGTEIDIAEVLNEMNVKLDETNAQLEKQKNSLRTLSSEISLKEQKMAIQQKEIAKQTADINSKQKQQSILKKKMNELMVTLSDRHEELSKNTDALYLKQQQLLEKEEQVTKLSEAISEKSNTLEAQGMQIAQQKSTLLNLETSLLNKEKELSSQSSTIRQQYIVMLLSFLFIVLVLGILFTLYKNSQNKKKSYEELRNKNQELADTNEQLIKTQSQLVESEKMAALGGLVAGVAHEINTPLGISVTAVSTSQHLIDEFTLKVNENKVSRSGMNTFLDKLNQTTALMNNNLVRASVLIRQFKLVAVDQSSEEKREFLLYEYLSEVLASLYPQYKKYRCDINIDCDDKIKMKSYPGGIAQIMTNLVMNSLLHGFNVEKKAQIALLVQQQDKHIAITYQDNGCGIDKDNYAQIFTPFYTTNRSGGGSGLGLHICYNIASKLGGEIRCVPCESGAKFILTIPKDITTE